jgi:hypothetical protein
MDVRDKVPVVTGGASRMGRGLGAWLAQAGASPVGRVERIALRGIHRERARVGRNSRAGGW